MATVHPRRINTGFSSNGYRIKVSKPKNDTLSRSFSRSVSKAIKLHQDKGLPIARYDAIGKKSYLEYSDGSRKYIEMP